MSGLLNFLSGSFLGNLGSSRRLILIGSDIHKDRVFNHEKSSIEESSR